MPRISSGRGKCQEKEAWTEGARPSEGAYGVISLPSHLSRMLHPIAPLGLHTLSLKPLYSLCLLPQLSLSLHPHKLSCSLPFFSSCWPGLSEWKLVPVHSQILSCPGCLGTPSPLLLPTPHVMERVSALQSQEVASRPTLSLISGGSPGK